MKKHLGAIGIAFSSVVGGVAVGATMLAPTVASAQTADATPDDDGAACAQPQHHHHRRGPGLDAAAKAIGISVDDLRAELHDGKSIADVAAANGVAVQTVIDAMVADVQEHLTQAVADGKLTQAQADRRLADATERITDHVSNPPPPRPDGEG